MFSVNYFVVVHVHFDLVDSLSAYIFQVTFATAAVARANQSSPTSPELLSTKCKCENANKNMCERESKILYSATNVVVVVVIVVAVIVECVYFFFRLLSSVFSGWHDKHRFYMFISV